MTRSSTTPPGGMLLPLHAGPEYIGGVPIYLADDSHFCTVSKSPFYDAHSVAKVIVESVNAAYHKQPRKAHAKA